MQLPGSFNQSQPKKLKFPATKCFGILDIHTHSGYRRTNEAEDIRGYGMRGLCSLRRGTPMKGAHSLSTSSAPQGQPNLVHLLDAVAKTHRLAIRSSYGAEIVGASHGLDDASPTLITLVELKSGILKPEQLKMYNECGNLPFHAYLIIDAESVYKSSTSKELKTPAEKTLLGHVMYLREKLEKGVIQKIQDVTPGI